MRNSSFAPIGDLFMPITSFQYKDVSKKWTENEPLTCLKTPVVRDSLLKRQVQMKERLFFDGREDLSYQKSEI